MALRVPQLTYLDDKGSALTTIEFLTNLIRVRDFANAFSAILESTLGFGGTVGPGAVNTSAKMTDRIITAAKLDWWANLFGVASGTDTYAVSISPSSPGPSAGYGDGTNTTMFLLVKFTNANTGAATLNVNGGGAQAIKKESATALVAGDIVAGGIYALAWDGTNWQLLTSAGGASAYESIFKVGLSVDQDIALGAVLPVQFNTVIFDPDGVIDPVAYDFTVPESGWYEITMRAYQKELGHFALFRGAALEDWFYGCFLDGGGNNGLNPYYYETNHTQIYNLSAGDHLAWLFYAEDNHHTPGNDSKLYTGYTYWTGAKLP